MKKMSETIIFFGNERLATGTSTTAPTLQALISAGYNVAAVISNFETGQSRNARILEIQTVAERHNIPVLLPSKLSEVSDQLEGFEAAIGVLVAYGKIVPQSVIDIFPCGIINIHPSLLPLHRGPTPIENVLLEGAGKTGVSIMQLVKEMDSGPVFAQSEVKLKGNEAKQALADKLLDIGKSMIIELLPGILDKSIVALPQDDSRATFDGLLSKRDGIIDWRKPAKQIEREIRAFIEWPKSHAKLAGKEVVITKARAVEGHGTLGGIQLHGKELIVFCGEGSLLIERIKPAGKNEMPIDAFLAGYRHFI